jgi:hypothetical protein
MRMEQQRSAARMIAPSPLVGEGSTDGHPKLGWVRGRRFHRFHTSWRPLTRPRFARPPSPTLQSFALLGGEGRILVAYFGALT